MGRFAGRNDHPRGGTEFHGLSGEVQVAETRRNGETICILHMKLQPEELDVGR